MFNVGPHGDLDHLLFGRILAPVSKGVQGDLSSGTNPSLELEGGPLRPAATMECVGQFLKLQLRL